MTTDAPPAATERARDRYSFTRRSEALGETVRIEKGPREASVVRADGTRQALDEFAKEEQTVWDARYGAFRPELLQKISEAIPGSPLDAFVWLADPEPGAAGEPDGSVGHRERHQAHVRALQDAATPRLRALGIEITFAGIYSPTLGIRGTTTAILALQHDPLVELVTTGSDGVGTVNAAPNGISETTVDVEWNAHGYFGAQGRVGLIDQGRLGLDRTHEAFANATVTYQVPPTSDPGECSYYGGGIIAGQCVNYHGSEVASVLSATRGSDQWGASQVALYYANDTVEPVPGNNWVACYDKSMIKAYDWFVANDVRLVMEPWSCGASGGADGLVQDYYSRVFTILPVHSAGNRGYTLKAGCKSLNGVCVGGHRTEHIAACLANAKNPDQQTDREEPDVTGLSGDEPIVSICPANTRNYADVIAVGSGTGWRQAKGTSYAVPAAALSSLFWETRCTPTYTNSAWRRLVLRHNTRFNPDAGAYSTPSSSSDWRDGGGAVSGPTFACQGTAPSFPIVDQGSAYSTSVVLRDGRPLPEGSCDGCGLGSRGVRALAAGGPTSASRVGQVLPGWHTTSLKKGDVLRLSLSWATCSTSQTTSTGPTDFDIFLYNRDLHSYLFSSQSVYDNNEGFQVSIPDGWDGNYDVYLSWPKSSSGCNGAGVEAVSALWAAWRP